MKQLVIPCALLLLIISFSVSGQIDQQRIIPPSPQAQQFMKYGEYPVDYSTGIPSIEIPLFTISSNQLELPIYLSYHASGIKPEDIASVAGLGWTLFNGGMVSRSVRGKADDAINGFFNVGIKSKEAIDLLPDNWKDYTDVTAYLTEVKNGHFDNESDLYSYLVNKSISGNFVFDINQNLNKTTHNNDSIIWNGSWFHIIDEKGVHYYFEKGENQTVNDDYTSTFSWYITKIKSSDCKDSICFEYFKDIRQYGDVKESFYSVNEAGNLECRMSSELYKTYTRIYSEHTMIKKITFKNGYLDFIYNDDRKDMRTYKLDNIKYYSNYSSPSTCLKQYNFKYGYFGETTSKNTCRLKLNEIQILDGPGSFLGKYSFGYNTTDLPSYYDLGSTAIKHYPYDFWGYFNGQYSNEHLLSFVPPYASYGYLLKPANREPNETYTQASILNQITYPTKGYTNFEYELNKLNDGTLIGGLRISRIESYDGISPKPMVKEYSYYGGINMRYEELENAYVSKKGINPTCNCKNMGPVEFTYYYSDPIYPDAYHNGSPVLYQLVKESAVGSNGEKSEIASEYLINRDRYYYVDDVQFNGKFNVDRSWARGQLVSQDFVKNNTITGEYKTVKQISRTYGDFKTKTIITGERISVKYPTYINKECVSGTPSMLPVYFLKTMYYYFDILTDIGTKKLEKEEEINYFDNGQVKKTTTYNYNGNKYLYPVSVTTTSSSGKSQKDSIKYLCDYGNVSNFNILKLKNIVNSPIDSRKYVNNILTDGQQIKFNDYGSPTDIFKVETGGGDVAFQFANPYTFNHKMSYLYNNNILKQAIKDNDISTYYVWGYNGQYPVVKIEIANNLLDIDKIQRDVNAVTLTSAKDKASIDATVGTLKSIVKVSEANSGMITYYTYSPLIGMTSSTDPNGLTTYYDYDDFGRLKLVKDKDANILKTYDYHYKQ